MKPNVALIHCDSLVDWTFEGDTGPAGVMLKGTLVGDDASKRFDTIAYNWGSRFNFIFKGGLWPMELFEHSQNKVGASFVARLMGDKQILHEDHPMVRCYIPPSIMEVKRRYSPLQFIYDDAKENPMNEQQPALAYTPETHSFYVGSLSTYNRVVSSIGVRPIQWAKATLGEAVEHAQAMCLKTGEEHFVVQVVRVITPATPKVRAVAPPQVVKAKKARRRG